MPLLPDAEAFGRLVRGEDRGLTPTLARAALAGLAVPFGAVVTLRNAAFDRGLFIARRAGVPVISIGNLTLGGTGKTPLVAWVTREMAARGLAPAIVSRGYGAARGEQSDEAAELAILLPGVPHVADRDRVAAARTAAAAGAEVVVLDDGFQHRRLARDLDIVTIDATDPWGGGRLFPRGLLREPLAGLTRARVAVLTRATSVAAERRREIRREAEQACAGRALPAWIEAEHRPLRVRAFSGTTRPLDWLAGRSVAAFAGIGNPAAFRGSLESCGGFRGFPDHHRYSDADLDSLGGWARETGADVILTTLKDLVKVRRDHLGPLPVFAVEISLVVLGGDGLEAIGPLFDALATRPGKEGTR